jgi:hypothetical protein
MWVEGVVEGIETASGQGSCLCNRARDGGFQPGGTGTVQSRISWGRGVAQNRRFQPESGTGIVQSTIFEIEEYCSGGQGSGLSNRPPDRRLQPGGNGIVQSRIFSRHRLESESARFGKQPFATEGYDTVAIYLGGEGGGVGGDVGRVGSDLRFKTELPQRQPRGDDESGYGGGVEGGVSGCVG